MAVNLRNAANSAAGTSLIDNDAFAVLLVAADGYFVGAARPVELSGGSTQATIAGQVIGGTAAVGIGFEANGGGDVLTVAGSGLISGETAVMIGGGGKVINLGTISGSATGVSSITGNLEIESHGTIRATTDAIKFSADATRNTLTNNGKIVGNILGGAAPVGLDKITNTGVINGAIDLKGGINEIVNSASGQILGRSNLGDYQAGVINSGYMGGIDSSALINVTNYGTIRGGINATGGGAYVYNYGTVDSISSSGSSITTYVMESGVVLGDVTDGAGITNMYVYGRINGSVNLGSEYGLIWNEGVIARSISFGDVHDNYFGGSGYVSGSINMGGGDDYCEGGASIDLVIGGTGNDKVALAGGNDVFAASAGSDGNDTVEGGDGLDTYDAGVATARVIIDLEDESATGTNIGSDAITGFENASGSNFNDFFLGTDGANVFDGRGGDDTILGKGGNDKIVGGGGADKIAGGIGRDQLTGGDGADTFFFYSRADSTVAATGRDLIFDFTSGTDKIDLSAIDASTKAAGNQAFAFLGAGAFTGVAGQLHTALVNGYTVLSGDVNGDKVADFAIGLKGVLTITAADFVL